jgi:Mg-chelatase subunit ChlD
VLWDKTISGVSIPTRFEGGGRDDNYDNTTICYSRLAEKTMVKRYEELGAYWAEYDVQPGAIYFGDTSGIFRMTPAQQYEECGGFDPRHRPWYKAASSPPKDVVLVIDTSQSMNGKPLLMAQAAAFTILDSLTASDRVAAVTVSMEAKVLLEDTALVEATDENKKRLTEAIVALETSGTFNWYDAFNSTFDILANSINSSEATIPCSSAVILLTDGSFDDQGLTDASDVISLVNEKQEELATTSNMKNYFFLYSLGEDANTTLTKNIACGTGGLWRHIGDDETQDLASALSSYYKLFATGLGDGDYTDFVAWVEPYQYEIESGMGSTVSVPVFDRSVTPYQILGVVGIDIYLDAIQQVFGDNTTSWFQEWMARSSIDACPANDLTECQLDALRFLGGGEDATCGACNSTDASSEEVCPSNVTLLPTDLWQNSNSE